GREDFVDRARELREIDPERRVRDALREHGEHDEARNDERAVRDAVHLRDPRADRGAEHDEVERGGDHGRSDALAQRAPHPRHLEAVNGSNCAIIHGFLTNLTKMSSRELCVVLRSFQGRSSTWRAWRSSEMRWSSRAESE